MKRLTALFLIIALILPITGTLAAAESIKDSQKVEEIATEYLREAAEAQYFYTECDLDRYTIVSVPADQEQALAEKTANYAAFRASQNDIPYEDTAISSGNISSLKSNLELHKALIEYYARLGVASNSTYQEFNKLYETVSTKVEGNFAAVDVYETLDFQYSGVDFTSLIETRFYISLVKHGGQWLVMAVESDDDLYSEYRDTGFAVDETVFSDEVASNNESEEEYNEDYPEGDNLDATTSYSPTANDRPYLSSNAVNYALTYTKHSTDTVYGDEGPSPWKNTNFYYNTADCMRFVSQCLWAGFGGSNTPSQIQLRKCMDTTVNLYWYGGKTAYTTGYIETTSWADANSFKQYIDACQLISDTDHVESRIHCSTHGVTFSKNQMLSGTSNANNNKLIGAAVLVKFEPADEYGHGIIITQVQQTSGVATRDSVYFTAYNRCFKNVRLSAKYGVPEHFSDPKYSLFVVMPDYLVKGNPGGGNYLYAGLKPTMVIGTTDTIIAYAKNQVSTMTIKVYKTDSSTPSYTFTHNNCSTFMSGQILFNQTGLWRVVVSADGVSTPYTFYIRVASSSDAGNNPS